MGTFEPDGPLWVTFKGKRYPTYLCAFCGGGFQEKDGLGIGFVSSDKKVCCSKVCAALRHERSDDPPMLDAWD